MDTQQKILQPFHPGANVLLERLCDEVQPKVLWFISEADYGNDSQAYLEVLERIQREKRIPKMPFDVALSEVVALTRWQEPEPLTGEDYDVALKINLAIAFSCTILLTVPDAWYYNRDGENSTVISLLEVCRELSAILPDLWEDVASLLAWRVTENGTTSEERPFFLYGLLLSGLLGKRAKEDELLALADYLIAEEGRCRADLQELGGLPIRESWLLGLAPFFNQRHENWRKTARWLEEEAGQARNPVLRKQLEALVDLVLD